MTSHPTRPGTRASGPGSSGWKKALLRLSSPPVNAFARSTGAACAAGDGWVTPYRVTSTTTPTTSANVTNRRVRTVKW